VHAELVRRGGRVLAVSTDSPAEAERMRDELDLPFEVLSDPRAEATRAFGLLHAGAGPGGKDVALPAQVLLDRDLRILWRHVAHRIQDRPAPRDVLAAIERHLR
jgi:peroxiredoxin